MIHRVKYWEIIADKLSKASWSLGWVSAIDSTGERSELLADTGAMESLSLCALAGSETPSTDISASIDSCRLIC